MTIKKRLHRSNIYMFLIPLVTAALLLILGGVILLVLGLIGEYIGRIFMCVNSSPQYVERSVVKRDEAP